MRRSLTVAALAALLLVAASGGSAFARTSGLSADELRDCLILELTGEGSCADRSPPSYEPPRSLTGSSDDAPIAPRNVFSSGDSSVPTPNPIRVPVRQ